MRRLLLAGADLAIATTAALGADPPPERRLPLPAKGAYVPFFTWNGAYVGINAGYGFGESQWTDNVTQLSTNKFSINGGVVGGTVGYNLQSAPWWSASKPIRLAASRARPRPLRRHLRNPQRLARHRARPHRLCFRPRPALFHRRRGGRRYQRLGRRAAAAPARPTPVGDRRRASNTPSLKNKNWSAKLEYFYVDLGDASLQRGVLVGWKSGSANRSTSMTPGAAA